MMDKELVSNHSTSDPESSYNLSCCLTAVYVYVYLTGQTVDRAGGGTIINWSSTYEILN